MKAREQLNSDCPTATTARRIDATSICPDLPKLYRAYGTSGARLGENLRAEK